MIIIFIKNDDDDDGGDDDGDDDDDDDDDDGYGDFSFFHICVYIDVYLIRIPSVWTFLPCTINITVTFPFHQVKAATELDKITRS